MWQIATLLLDQKLLLDWIILHWTILRICKIPEDGFKLLPRLTNLKMHRCQLLSVLPLFIKCLHNLHYLGLAENHLSHIAGYSFTSHSLNKVDLSANRITHFEILAFSGSTNISVVDLRGNRLHSIISVSSDAASLARISFRSNKVRFTL